MSEEIAKLQHHGIKGLDDWLDNCPCEWELIGMRHGEASYNFKLGELGYE